MSPGTRHSGHAVRAGRRGADGPHLHAHREPGGHRAGAVAVHAGPQPDRLHAAVRHRTVRLTPAFQTDLIHAHDPVWIGTLCMCPPSRRCDVWLVARSLCILDEFGKGTLTADGVGLLCATLRRFADMSPAPKVIACTHFSEVMDAGLLPRQAARARLKLLLLWSQCSSLAKCGMWRLQGNLCTEDIIENGACSSSCCRLPE